MEKYLKLKVKDREYIIENYDIKCDLDRMCKIISGFDKYGMYYQIKLKIKDIVVEEEQEDCLFIEAI